LEPQLNDLGHIQAAIERRLHWVMKIGNPIKGRIKISERRGHYVVTGDMIEIVTPTLRSARRLGVVLRRVMGQAFVLDRI